MDVIIARCLLQDILDKKKVSRTQLMDMTGMSKQQVSNYINMEKQMSLKTSIKIAHVLNCNSQELYEYKIVK